MKRRLLFAFLVLVLIGAALNLPVALYFVQPQSKAWQPTIHLSGAEASACDWPAEPPLAWPEIDSWQEMTRFGHRHIDARTVEGGRSTHSMDVDLYGWPLPALRDRQFWWPWDDPKWSTDLPSDPGMELHWSGVLVNPLLFGAAMWLLLIGPFLVVCTVRTLRRRKARRCTACGYPIGESSVCTECGAALPANGPPG